MYLRDLCIRNVGPIISCDVRPQFKDNGNPKPLFFVGTNGSGKTILLSSVADAIIQKASTVFTDVARSEGIQRPMFRVSGATNQRAGSPYSVTLLKFESNGHSAEYIERTGELDLAVETEVEQRFPGIRGQSDSKDPFYKDIKGLSDNAAESLFRENAYCYFPASRREDPHWQNVDAFPDIDGFDEVKQFRETLGKQLVVAKSAIENFKWILDVVLDSRLDVELKDGSLKTVDVGTVQAHLLFGQARRNIESLLQQILEAPNARLVVGWRRQGSRLQIDLGNGVVIPSLSHLSLGQSVLFNLFCAIIRSADFGDINKGHQLAQVTGIAIIDEIEAHLHEVLRFHVLPKLIAMFPRVQFIVATHSPSLLLGLDRLLGVDAYTIIEMPGGIEITSERFSEFKRSIEHLQGTALFESAVLDYVTRSGSKPCILTEGDTDRDYIRCALVVNGRMDLLERVDVDWIGSYDEAGNAFNAGASGLDAAARLFKANPDMLRRRVLLLYDCDTRKQDQDITRHVWQRRVPENRDNAIMNKGIENLLPSVAVEDEDYDTREVVKDYGGMVTTRELNKRRMCDRICNKRDPSHFAGFDVIVMLIDDFLAGDQVEAEQ